MTYTAPTARTILIAAGVKSGVAERLVGRKDVTPERLVSLVLETGCGDLTVVNAVRAALDGTSEDRKIMVLLGCGLGPAQAKRIAGLAHGSR